MASAADFWYLFRFHAFLLLKILKLFDFQRTWWRVFQKRVMRTKFDLHVFIVKKRKTNVGSINWFRFQSRKKGHQIRLYIVYLIHNIHMVLLRYTQYHDIAIDLIFHHNCISMTDYWCISIKYSLSIKYCSCNIWYSESVSIWLLLIRFPADFDIAVHCICIFA